MDRNAVLRYRAVSVHDTDGEWCVRHCSQAGCRRFEPARPLLHGAVPKPLSAADGKRPFRLNHRSPPRSPDLRRADELQRTEAHARRTDARRNLAHDAFRPERGQRARGGRAPRGVRRIDAELVGTDDGHDSASSTSQDRRRGRRPRRQSAAVGCPRFRFAIRSSFDLRHCKSRLLRPLFRPVGPRPKGSARLGCSFPVDGCAFLPRPIVELQHGLADLLMSPLKHVFAEGSPVEVPTREQIHGEPARPVFLDEPGVAHRTIDGRERALALAVERFRAASALRKHAQRSSGRREAAARAATRRTAIARISSSQLCRSAATTASTRSHARACAVGARRTGVSVVR